MAQIYQRRLRSEIAEKKIYARSGYHPTSEKGRRYAPADNIERIYRFVLKAVFSIRRRSAACAVWSQAAGQKSSEKM